MIRNNYFMIDLITQTRISKLCLKHFGFQPNRMDIIRKLSHINRIDNRAPCDMEALAEHITKTMIKFIANNYLHEKKKVIEDEIKRIRQNSKPLPLP